MAYIQIPLAVQIEILLQLGMASSALRLRHDDHVQGCGTISGWVGNS